MRVPSTALDAESILPLVPSRPVVAAPDTCGRRTRQPTHSDPQQFEAGATDWRPQGSAVALHGTLEVKTFAPDIYPQKKYPLTPNRNPNPFVRGDVRVVFLGGQVSGGTDSRAVLCPVSYLQCVLMMFSLRGYIKGRNVAWL